MPDQNSELRKEVKEGVYEIRDDFGRAREEINRTISLALAEIRHHDKQRHTDYHAINEKIDYFFVEVNKRLERVDSSTATKIDSLKYWMIGTSIGIISIMLGVLKILY